MTNITRMQPIIAASKRISSSRVWQCCQVIPIENKTAQPRLMSSAIRRYWKYRNILKATNALKQP